MNVLLVPQGFYKIKSLEVKKSPIAFFVDICYKIDIKIIFK